MENVDDSRFTGLSKRLYAALDTDAGTAGLRAGFLAAGAINCCVSDEVLGVYL
jgi:hypothetical protein